MHLEEGDGWRFEGEEKKLALLLCRFSIFEVAFETFTIPSFLGNGGALESYPVLVDSPIDAAAKAGKA